MKIKQLVVGAAVLVFSGIYGPETFAQTTGPEATVTDTERTSNRSGLTESDRGSFEAEADPQGRVGRSAEDISEMLREMRGTDRRQQRTNVNVDNLNERRNRRNRQRAQRNPPPPVHVQFRPTFSIPSASSSQVAKRMQSDFSRLLKKRGTGTVQVVLNDRTATLTGTVNSEHERSLLERMVRIEPGVSVIENLIAVEEPPQALLP